MQKVVTMLFAVFVAASPAAAQDYKPVDFNFGFGWAFPTSDFGSSFDAGWHGTFGATYNINEHVGIQAEYTYLRMDGPERTISVVSNPIAADITNGLLESNHQMHVGTFDLIYKAQSQEHPIGGYALGGGGIYHRIVQLTSPSVGYATFCDPYWYVCYPTLVSVDTIIGDRSSNDFGVNFGGGVTFGREGKFYVESRLHYVWGQKITNATQLPAAASTTATCADGCSTNATYYPITFGFRW
jgi:Outer membrane protein beta-barrel domain